MDSLVNGNPMINICKHPTEGVKKYQWIVLDTYKYGLAWMHSPYSYDSFDLALTGWKQFAEINNIKNWQIYKEGNQVQDIRTGSGAQI